MATNAPRRSKFRPLLVVTWVPLVEGVISVLDPYKPAPQWWKPPGGRAEWTDVNAKSAALREFTEETGGTLTDLTMIGRPLVRVNKDGDTYETHVFKGTPAHDCRERLLERGNEGEYVRIIPYDELRTMQNYHPLYKMFMVSHGLWPK